MLFLSGPSLHVETHSPETLPIFWQVWEKLCLHFTRPVEGGWNIKYGSYVSNGSVGEIEAQPKARGWARHMCLAGGAMRQFVSPYCTMTPGASAVKPTRLPYGEMCCDMKQWSNPGLLTLFKTTRHNMQL